MMFLVFGANGGEGCGLKPADVFEKGYSHGQPLTGSVN